MSAEQSQDGNSESNNVNILSEEETNFLRIANLLYRVAPSAVRVKFNIEFNPSGLFKNLTQNRFKVLEPLKKKRVINQKQWDLLYPRTGTVSSENFDLTLMLCLIRHLTPIQIGDVLPFHTDHSSGADLSRLKYYRNEIVHCDDGILTDIQFQEYWKDITQAICRLGGSSYDQKCNDLKVSKLDSNDREVITELRNVEISNNPIPKGLQCIYLKTIEQWRADDQHVVETRAMLYLREILQTENVVTVIGVSGCEKSTTVQHEALHLQKEQGYNIVPISSAVDLLQYYDLECKQLFVIDNVCGSYAIELHLVKEWERLSPTVMSILENNTVKILFVSRSHIYQNHLFKNVKLFSSKIYDLLSCNISLTNTERILIAKKNLTEEEVLQLQCDDLYTKYEFFPLLCKFYASKKTSDIRTFFARPVEAVMSDLLSLKNAHDQVTYATLVLFVIHDNCIPQKALGRNSGIKCVMEHLSDNCERLPHFSIQVLKSQLNNLEGSYVKNTGNTYSIIHDKLFDIIVSFYGSQMFDVILEHCHTNILRDRFLFESLNLEGDECLIKVNPDKEEVYFSRLSQDIKDGNIGNVFTNNQMQYIGFREKFIAYVLNTDEIKTLIKIESDSESSPLFTVAEQGYCDFVRVLLTELCLNVNISDSYGRTPLLLASKNGHAGVAKYLLENSADPNIRSRQGMSPILAASSQGHTCCVEVILQFNCNLNLCDSHNRSALLLAVGGGYTDVVKLLLEHDCNVDIEDNDGVTPLYLASQQGSIEIAKLLIEHNCNPNYRGKNQNPPLQAALLKGHTEVAIYLLTNGSDPNITGLNYIPSLYIVSSERNEQVMSVLLNNKFEINNDNITSSLDIAIMKGEIDTVKFLLDNKCYPLPLDKLVLLGIAVQTGKTEFVRLLLQHNFDEAINSDHNIASYSAFTWRWSKIKRTIVNQKKMMDVIENSDIEYTPSFYTQSYSTQRVPSVLKYIDNDNSESLISNQFLYPLHIASSRGDVEVIQLLLQYQCNPDLLNRSKQSALFTASENGHLAAVKFLLEHNCKPDLCDNYNQSPLYTAASGGHIEIVKLLLEHKCNPELCNKDNESPLYIAASGGHIEIVKLLLEHKCDPHFRNINNKSPLYIATSGGHIGIVELLLERKCNPDICNEYNQSPLYIGSKYGYSEIVKLLLQYKCDPMLYTKYSSSPLYISASCGHIEIVKLLLEQKCNPDVCNKENESPLYIASRDGHTEIVKLLLEHKCNPDICNKYNQSPLYIASNYGYLEIVKLLLQYKCDPDLYTKDYNSSMFIAASGGHIAIVKLLLEHKCDPHLCNKYNKSPLYIAASRGHSGIVQLLLEHKCDPDICNEYNQSPLYIASGYGYFEVVKLLLQYKCYPNQCTTKNNESPMYIAASCGHIEIVKLLLEHKCNPDLCNKDNKSPLYIASRDGHTEIVKLLLEHKCNPDLCNKDNESPLYKASCYGHTEIVKLLLKHKCYPDLCNKDNKSPLYNASRYGHTEIVKLLLEHKCYPDRRNKDKESPLYKASRYGHTKIVKLLLKHKCYPDLCNKDNKSPLYNASRYGHTEIVKLLLEHNCNPHLRNKFGKSPFYIASCRGFTEITKLFLENIINTSLRDNYEGKSTM